MSVTGFPRTRRPLSGGDRRFRHRPAMAIGSSRRFSSVTIRPQASCPEVVDAGSVVTYPGQPARPPPLVIHAGAATRCGRGSRGTTYPCAAGGPNDYIFSPRNSRFGPAIVGAKGGGGVSPSWPRSPFQNTAEIALGKSPGINAIIEEWTVQRSIRGHAVAGRRGGAGVPARHRRSIGRPASEGARYSRRHRLPGTRPLTRPVVAGQLSDSPAELRPPAASLRAYRALLMSFAPRAGRS